MVTFQQIYMIQKGKDCHIKKSYLYYRCLSRYTEIGLDRNEREEVGRRCKHIIDWGRLKYLEGEGMKCAMNVYVNQNVSLENVCLVAFYENKLLS